jgi:sugar phosphate isomerase/epimerase
MKIGANTVLFGAYDMETSFKYLSMAGYDGVEVCAVVGQAEHLLVEENWQEVAPKIKQLAKTYDLELLAMEQNRPIPAVMEKAFQAAVEIGIPIVNCGPGGKTDDESTYPEVLDTMGTMVTMAEKYGVTLCVKAHVGQYIYNTPTSLKILNDINSDYFGLDMDPSHIYRANENPVEAIEAVVSRIKHVHIRDCKGRQQGPGDPADQANGRGDIDLVGYIRVLHEHGYTGPLDLEVIGTKAKEYTLEQCCTIAAEARGHMQACLQACGAR